MGPDSRQVPYMHCVYDYGLNVIFVLEKIVPGKMLTCSRGTINTCENKNEEIKTGAPPSDIQLKQMLARHLVSKAQPVVCFEDRSAI